MTPEREIARYFLSHMKEYGYEGCGGPNPDEDSLVKIIEVSKSYGFEKGLAQRDALIHGQGITLDGKRIDPADIYKTPDDYIREGFEKAKEQAARLVEKMLIDRPTSGNLIYGDVRDAIKKMEPE